MEAANKDVWVLLAEDDPDLREVVSETLRDEGYTVSEAKNGLELVNFITDASLEGARSPDVIIADVMMPYFTGTEALSCAGRSELKSPFILITAQVDAGPESLGARMVFHKPFELDALMVAVASLVDASPGAARDTIPTRSDTETFRPGPE